MIKENVITTINELKGDVFGSVTIPCKLGTCEYELSLLTAGCVDDDAMMNLLGRWRKENEFWFAATFPVSLDRTIRWFQKGVIDAPDRLLFIIKTHEGYVGHVGLFRFYFEKGCCEIDNIVRGETAIPGIIGNAIEYMTAWGKQTLGITYYTLQTVSDNDRAIRLYNRLGFQETKREPLVLTTTEDGVAWIPAPEGYNPKDIKRYDVYMEQAHA